MVYIGWKTGVTDFLIGISAKRIRNLQLFGLFTFDYLNYVPVKDKKATPYLPLLISYSFCPRFPGQQTTAFSSNAYLLVSLRDSRTSISRISYPVPAHGVSYE